MMPHYPWKYAPRREPPASSPRFTVRSPGMYTVDEHAACAHVRSVYLSVQDERSDELDVYTGRCCVACGRITAPMVRRV